MLGEMNSGPENEFMTAACLNIRPRKSHPLSFQNLEQQQQIRDLGGGGGISRLLNSTTEFRNPERQLLEWIWEAGNIAASWLSCTK